MVKTFPWSKLLNSEPTSYSNSPPVHELPRSFSIDDITSRGSGKERVYEGVVQQIPHLLFYLDLHIRICRNRAI